eukprot:1161677-Pelagomonas_calceolata.AAC.3
MYLSGGDVANVGMLIWEVEDLCKASVRCPKSCTVFLRLNAGQGKCNSGRWCLESFAAPSWT